MPNRTKTMILLAALTGHLLWTGQALAEQAGPVTAHMFVVDRLTGGSILRLFNTHPSAEERIAWLENAADAMGAVSATMRGRGGFRRRESVLRLG